MSRDAGFLACPLIPRGNVNETKPVKELFRQRSALGEGWNEMQTL